MTITGRAIRTLVLAAVAASLIAASLPGRAASELPALPVLSKAQLLSIANVDAPPAGIGLRVHADFPEESPLVLAGVPFHSLTAAITPEGDVELIEAHAAQESRETVATGVDPCKDRMFAPTGVRWSQESLPVEWKIRTGTIPRDVNRFLAIRSLRKAHQVWPRSITDCPNPDSVNFKFSYTGRTGKTVIYDGINMIEFGKLGSGALAVNYTWFRGTEILEADMRLNRADYHWTARTSDAPKRYIIANVVTHELGHQVGLADLNDPHAGLTMFARISKGENHKMRLGRGDMKGAATVDP